MVDALGAVREIVEERRLRRHFRQPRIVVHQLILAVFSRDVGPHVGRTELAVRHIEQRRFRNQYVELVAHPPLQGICALVQRYILSHGLILLIESRPTIELSEDFTPARMLVATHKSNVPNNPDGPI